MTGPLTPGDGEPPSRSLWRRWLRDVVIVLAGVFILVNESVTGSDRPSAWAAGIACFGLPFVLRAEERR